MIPTHGRYVGRERDTSYRMNAIDGVPANLHRQEDNEANYFPVARKSVSGDFP